LTRQNDIRIRVIIAGFGGQGVLSMGLLLTYAGMYEGYEVAWLPSYGPEMRGGTANCHVTISSEAITTPIVTKNADYVVAMNLPSLDRFEPVLGPGATLVINSSFVPREPSRKDIVSRRIDLALHARLSDSNRTANMIVMGYVSYLIGFDVISHESYMKGMRKLLGEGKASYMEDDIRSFEYGIKLAENDKI
jgi:2-oxoglutarate ferredoxin oxidoreductase subunit gamma